MNRLRFSNDVMEPGMARLTVVPVEMFADEGL